MKDLLKSWYFRFLVIFSLLAPTLGSWIVSAENFLWFKMPSSNDWIGFLGSYLGGIIGGLFTLLGVLLTLKKQHQQDTQIEKNQVEQDKKLSMLQFENTLFRLIDLQNEGINHLRIETLRNEWVEGKQCFEWLVTEAKQVIEEISDEDYKQFNVKINDTLEFNIIKSAFEELFGKFEHTLAHYFRNITYTIKLIDTIEDPQLKENYLSILKAQLTQSELQTIFYFTISIEDLEDTYKLIKSASFFSTSIDSILFKDYHSFFFQRLDEYKNIKIDEISLFLDSENVIDDSEEEFLKEMNKI